MAYSKVGWTNNFAPYINESNLGHMDEGIANVDGSLGYDGYNNTSTYTVGDYCIYNNKLYVCNTAIATAEEFNSEHWTETSINGIISGVKNDVSSLAPILIGSLITSSAGTISDQHSYRIGNVIGLSFKLTGVSGTSQATKVVAQLGEGLRPTSETTCMVSIPGHMLPGWIRTSGEICVVPTGNISNAEVTVGGSFLLE